MTIRDARKRPIGVALDSQGRVAVTAVAIGTACRSLGSLNIRQLMADILRSLPRLLSTFPLNHLIRRNLQLLTH